MKDAKDVNKKYKKSMPHTLDSVKGKKIEDVIRE